MVAKSIWLLCCVALVAAGSDKGGKGDKKGDGEEKEEDVKDASGLRARVNSNDFCAKPISGEAIKAFISCPDVREYKVIYSFYLLHFYRQKFSMHKIFCCTRKTRR